MLRGHCFPVTAFSLTHLPAPEARACHRAGRVARQKCSSQEGPHGKKESGGRGSHVPARPRGGAVALLRAAKASGGAGQKIYCSQAGCKGKGRFYKFLNFMTMCTSGMSTQSVGTLAQKTCTAHIKYRMKCCSEYLLAKI